MTDEEIAEEYAKGLCKTCTFDTCRHSIIQTCAIKESIKQAYKDGAEFGYNKAKEEMQEQGLALQSDMDKTIEQNIQLKKQIDKIRNYLANDIPHELINEATNKIWKMV